VGWVCCRWGMCSYHKAIFDGPSRLMSEVQVFLSIIQHIGSFLLHSHTFPSWNDARRGLAYSQSLPLSSALGGGVPGLGACLVRVFNEKERGQRAESPIDIGRSRRQLGPRYSSYQYLVPERSSHVRFRPFSSPLTMLILGRSRLAYDRGWRVRTDWKQYQLLKQ
jgi:hypothetical protein